MMSHYEERLEADLEQIRRRVREVGTRVEEAIKDAVHALLSHDLELANKVILGDLPINREVRAIDRLCHAFVARHLPSAGHLRTVSSVLRLNVELERVGDYAVAIGREAVQLSGPPPDSLRGAIDLIADQARGILNQALRAYHEANAELARGTKGMAKQVDRTFQRVFGDLLREGERSKRPLQDLFAMLVVINRLGRVSDQAKNICEDTLFAVTGETKAAKVYRVLFLDRRNDAVSLLAQAFAHKAFPESGQFESAGWEPAGKISTHLELFLDRNGLQAKELAPRSLETIREDLSDYHVIVGLEPGAREAVSKVPFHTVLLDWSIGALPPDLDQERAAATLEEAYRRLSVEIGDLMRTLSGESAS